MNRTGTRVWELLADGRDPSEIPALLAREFAADEEVVRAELRALLASLLEADLLVRRE